MDAAEALTLATIIYRGCEYNLSNPNSRKIVYDEMIRCLNTFSAVQGKWELVWGPAGSCPDGIGLDDSAMFVVRNKLAPNTLAIVIRGTNLFSLRDWETNFLVDPKPWPYGNAGTDVIISHSTSLGLGFLQTLQSEPLPPQSAPIPAIAAAAKAVAVKAYAAALYAVLTRILSGAPPVAGTPSFDVEQIFDGIKDQVSVVEVKRLFGMVKQLFGMGDDATLLNDASAAQPPSTSAKTLLQFLTGFVDAAGGPVDISVVGHSKGGALAPALALWLADTQGTVVTASDQWDPGCVATLQVLTFAGPTAGNSGFANRFVGKFAGAYRLFNPHDIVPHAWDPAELRLIPDLYGNQLTSLQVPAWAVAEFVEGYGYQHEVAAQPWSLPLEPDTLPAHVAYNHLDAYLTELGIPDPGLRFLEVFKPILPTV